MTADDAHRRADELIDALSAAQQRAVIDALRADNAQDRLHELLRTPDPVIGQVPDRIRGIRIRVDLIGARPPVWRRLELPGDLTLDRLHTAVQAAMGWLDCHLHRFRTGSDPRAPYFVTAFDIEDGDDGIVEDTVRVDQLLTEPGDRLWYDYDFGDDWGHVLHVEAVLDEPPTTVRCTAGRNACPPEDSGGIWGYTDLAAWVRGGCDPTAVPAPFDTAGQAHDWLPLEWHPDRFDPADATAAITAAMAPPVAVPAELAALRTRLDLRGDPALTLLLEHATTGPVVEVEVGDAEAAQLLDPYLLLLDAIGDGVALTAAGYLPPALVEHLADQAGVTGWWIGAANREDLTVPVARLRATARTLGLISVRKRRLAPTSLARRARDRPLVLWRHLISRLPVGRTDFDRQAGWVTVAVVAGGVPAEHWHTEIAAVLQALGWRTHGTTSLSPAAVANPTLEVFDILAGATRGGRPTGARPAVAATARAVLTL